MRLVLVGIVLAFSTNVKADIVDVGWDVLKNTALRGTQLGAEQKGVELFALGEPSVHIAGATEVAGVAALSELFARYNNLQCQRLEEDAQNVKQLHGVTRLLRR